MGYKGGGYRTWIRRKEGVILAWMDRHWNFQFPCYFWWRMRTVFNARAQRNVSVSLDIHACKSCSDCSFHASDIASSLVAPAGGCAPRPVCVAVPPPRDADALYWPPCTPLLQCDAAAGCGSDALRCVPTTSQSQAMLVRATDFHRGEGALLSFPHAFSSFRVFFARFFFLSSVTFLFAVKGHKIKRKSPPNTLQLTPHAELLHKHCFLVSVGFCAFDP